LHQHPHNKPPERIFAVEDTCANLAKGDLVDWVEYSISYYHNQYIANETMRYDPTATNGSDRWPRESNSYTTLVRTGETTAYVSYGLKGAYGFAMPFELEA